MIANSRVAFRSGAGRLCLDFVRTNRHRGRPDATEELATPTLLAQWVDELGPRGLTSESATQSDWVESARELREAIYRLLVTASRPEGSCSLSFGERECINDWAGRDPPRPFVTAAGSVEYRTTDAIAATLTLVARDALDLVAHVDIHRLRNCANPDCQILFLDTSRPGMRRWCSMATCGNQAKRLRQKVE